MKKLILFSFLALVSMAACKKKGCWKCTTREVGGAASILPGAKAIATSTICDKTDEEIRQWEKDHTGTETYEENGKEYTLTAETVCK